MQWCSAGAAIFRKKWIEAVGGEIFRGCAAVLLGSVAKFADRFFVSST